MKTYRHYGSDKFDPKICDPIKNIDHFSKPDGGLWGIPKDRISDVMYFLEDSGWFELLGKTKSYFDFSLKDDSKILIKF